ncbi:organic cation transporter protein isoform X2 [Bombyx mori]|uniref:Major facilitator superfamily (MFS) profile domain-containing protein n=1 Tax=Bombyx mori TaxID=7091 RepID=A0A8R2G8H9_BOMMO|nr:organic cation transporter protein isoform X2 [Bombyx mori]
MSIKSKDVLEEPNDDVVLEKILSRFRPLGPYYRRFMPFLIIATISNAFYCMNYVFAAVSVDYRCRYECERNHSLVGSALNLSLKAGKCYKYSLIDENGDCSVDNFNVSNVEACKEWAYDEPESFVAEFQLGCQEWKRTLVGTVHSFGYMLGLLLLGPISDKVGRKKLLVFTGIVGGILGFSRSIISYYWAYIALELLEALLGDSYSPNYMLGVEMVAKQNRVFFGPLMIGSMSVAGILLSLVAWLLPNWRLFLRVIYSPALIFILYGFFLDESVRWLLIKGKKEEAKKILRKAAEISNLYLDEETLDSIESEKSTDCTSFIKLLKMTIMSRKLLLRFLACLCMWITSTFNKYALLINSVSLEGNKYVNYALIAFADLPASITLIFILIKFKRKGSLMFSFFLTGLFCVIQSLVPKGYSTLSLSLFFMGKLASAQSYATVYLYTSELFPTYTRNTMHAVCSSVGRIGSILAPQTPLLRQFWPGLPSVIIGSLSVITGMIVMMMPDTAEDVLPDTIKEAEALGMKTVKDKKAVVKLLK